MIRDIFGNPETGEIVLGPPWVGETERGHDAQLLKNENGLFVDREGRLYLGTMHYSKENFLRINQSEKL